ncbi:conjugal transfer protein [Citrobacter freundii]|uniref:TrbM/KikA/MpfK family conjugal transfer protein n=1 Tax=Citrobacter freundii TaxID=546 RepID=UPI000C7FEFAD|nr:TrbM/KikA/MpfK family conjugal transfer protein [Citrobacter freundii]EMB4337266.1 conjugal transfer protein [Citrobacter freundii]MBJ9041912.1 conjugal transfer protein [Citrobacter freundii]NTY76588.1 conjugal transfer protein [Citrobacter freundii]NUA13036.1 conjugal transfer protein [Citrobacter freundii]PMD03463.1 conjugal transfer protein [Citrobacter freundii]
MKEIILPALLICVMSLFSTPIMAADACKVVLCMYGKTTGNSGGDECHAAEQSFFTIVKKNKHGFLPNHTANARKSFLLDCNSADPAVIRQIISKFGRVRS